ncbi:MAG: metal-dependent hydrolase [Deltaproteobacteria bacterium]|nr:metal-dependent hydrolase [Deltaproteobacteria bacterium]
MDSITQVALGAAVGEAVGGRTSGKKAMGYGALAGLLPDLDILMGPFFHPTEQLLVHRGISHSLIFAVALCPVFARGVKKMHRGDPGSFLRWMTLFFLSLVTHSLLDIMTIYGTGFLEPFHPARLSTGVISIVDPLYSLPLVCTLIAALVAYRKKWAHRLVIIGLVASHLYLAGAGAAKLFIGRHFDAELAKAGINHSEVMTSPAFFNTILWYGVARGPDGIWLGYHSFLDKDSTIQFQFFPRNDKLEKRVDAKVLSRLKTFSKGWHVMSEKEGRIYFHDMRFGALDETTPVFSYDFKAPDKRPFATGGDSVDIGAYFRRVLGEKPLVSQ